MTSPLLSLQITDLDTVPTRIYKSLNEKIACVNYAQCWGCYFQKVTSYILLVSYFQEK